MWGVGVSVGSKQCTQPFTLFRGIRKQECLPEPAYRGCLVLSSKDQPVCDLRAVFLLLSGKQLTQTQHMRLHSSTVLVWFAGSAT